MEPKTDPVEHRETEFVKSLAGMLDRQQQQGDFDRLVIAAAPIALGDIRKAISPAVKKTIVAELNKDLTNLPTAQLDQHLRRAFIARLRLAALSNHTSCMFQRTNAEADSTSPQLNWPLNVLNRSLSAVESAREHGARLKPHAA